MVTKRKQFAWLMGLLITVQGLGCAASCRRSSECGSVACGQCESGCTHHQKQGTQYLSERPVEAEPAIDITRRPYDD